MNRGVQCGDPCAFGRGFARTPHQHYLMLLAAAVSCDQHLDLQMFFDRSRPSLSLRVSLKIYWITLMCSSVYSKTCGVGFHPGGHQDSVHTATPNRCHHGGEASGRRTGGEGTVLDEPH